MGVCNKGLFGHASARGLLLVLAALLSPVTSFAQVYDYDGVFTMSWTCNPPANQGGYSQLQQNFNGAGWANASSTKPLTGPQSHTVTVTNAGTYQYRADCAYMPQNPCPSGPCSPQLSHTFVTLQTVIVSFGTPPTISDIGNQTINEDGNTGSLGFTVGDADTAAGSLTATASSSNTTLVPNANLSLGGSGASRTITATPAVNLSGTATITVTVSDGTNSASDTFVLTVNAVNDTPTISNISDQTINEDANTGALSFTIGDPETAVGSLTVTAFSSNTALIPNASLSLGGSGASRTITATPAANQSGTSTITVTVSDGALSVSDTFVVTVIAVNDTPTISNISNQTISEDAGMSALGFTIGDVETAAASLAVTATSSNTTLVPNANLSLGGSSASRTLTATPAANQYGTTTITVTVSDGSLSASDTFVLTVAAQPELNLPATSSTGTFTVSFGEVSGATYVLLEENIGGTWTGVPGGGASGSDMGSVELTRADGTHTFRLRGCAVTGSQAGTTTTCNTVLTKSIVIEAPAPTVSASFNVSSINEGGSATFNWSSTGALSCSATGISGVSGTSGSTPYNAPVNMSANQTGTVTLTCIGNGGSTTQTATITINWLNDAPTISNISNQTISEDGNTGNLSFTIGDEETASSSLTVTAAFSDSTVGNCALSLGGSGASRTIMVTPAANQSGTATITVTVSDGVNSANDTFVLTATAVNDAPTISNIGNQTTNEDTSTASINFTVGDLETEAGSLTVTSTSSNTTLIPNANLALTNSGASRTLTATPAANQAGTSTITVTVSDGALSASDTFVVTVNAVNDAPTISNIGNQTINEDANTGSLSFTIGDQETATSSLTVTASSSNTTLAPNANLSLGGSGASRTITATPAANQSGSATITVTVSDGSLTANNTFVLTVNAVNDTPTISNISNQTISENANTGSLGLTVGDLETASGSLTVTASSGNTTLVPNNSANLTLSGSGASRTIIVTPAANQSGSATITVTVSDGSLTASDTFVVTVLAIPLGLSVPVSDGDGSYTVSWNTVSGATTYELQESINGGANWSTIQNTSGTSKGFSGGSAKGNGSYSYHVRACSAGGCSNYTATQTTHVAIAPGVPANLGVALGVDGTSISASWGAASGSITNYQLQQRIDGGSWSEVYSGTALTTIPPFSGLSAGEYAYQARACKTVGAYTNCSAWTVSVTGYVPGLSGGVPADSDAYDFLSPRNAETFQYLDGDGNFTLSWGAYSSGYNYSVVQSGPTSATYGTGSATSRSFTNLADGLYSFTLTGCHTFSTPGGPVTQCHPIVNPDAPLQVLVHKIAPNNAPATFTVPTTDADGAFTVSWSAHHLATTYELQESTDGGSTWNTIQNNSSTSESISGKGNGSYSYRVRACNGAGCSAYSAIKTTNVAIAPGLPGGFGVVLGTNGTSITVNWSAATGSITNYELQQRIDGGGWNTVYSGTALTRSFSGLNAAAYGYQVRACKTVGVYTNCSLWAQSYTGYVPGVTNGVPDDADAYSFSAEQSQYLESDSDFTLSWSAVSGAHYYKLTQTTPSSEIYTISGSSHDFGNLADGLYTFSVSSCVVYYYPGGSTESCTPLAAILQVSVQKLKPANPPTTFSVPSFDTDGEFTVSWNTVSAAMTYELQERVNGGSWATIQNTSTVSKSFTGKISALYEYQVRACNEAGCSDYSGIKATHSVRPPAMPASITAAFTSNGAGINVSWSPVSGSAMIYQLQRSANDGNWFTVYAGNALSYVDPNLRSARYEYRVRACSSVSNSVNGTSIMFNNCSLWTASTNAIHISGFSNGSPNDSDSHTFITGSTRYIDYDGTFTLTWPAMPGEESYRLSQQTPTSQTWDLEGLSKSFSNLPDGVYLFVVMGCHMMSTPGDPVEVCGSGAIAIEVHVRRMPAVPVLTVPVTSADGDYTVSWSSTSATAYELQERVNGGAFTTIQNSSATSINMTDKTEGGYGYKVRACNAIGCSVYTAVEVIAVTPGAGGTSASSSGGGVEEEEFFPALEPGESELVSPINGAFSVSQNGAATYSIPLQIPPARGGLAPELSLEYDSQSGNGMLGLGWSLSGLSAITRCAATKVPDGKFDPVDFDSNDKYCLGGEKLIEIDTGSDNYGSYKEYRTEVDSFSRIRSYGIAGSGPASFRVWTRSGRLMEYGVSSSVDDEIISGTSIPASRVEAQNRTDVLTWAVNKVSDSAGNYYTVSYREDNDNGEQYPLSIQYTGNSITGSPTHSSIEFTYEGRTDDALYYVGGTAQKMMVRLSSIHTNVSNGPVKVYKLTYDSAGVLDRSVLTGITECDSQNNCRPELEFTWRVSDDGEFTRETANTSLPIGSSIEESKKAMSRLNFGDFNGDGKTDVYYLKDSDSERARVYYSNGDGTFGNSNVTTCTNWTTGCTTTLDSYGPAWELAGEKAEAGFLRFADFTGDLQTDLYMIGIGSNYWFGDDGDSEIYSSWFSGWGNDFFGPSVLYISNEEINSGAAIPQGDYQRTFTDAMRIKFGDFNGDGKTDIYRVRGGSGQADTGKVYLRNGGTADGPNNHPINGSEARLARFDINRVMFGDFNGDGMSDIYQVEGWNSNAEAKIWLSDGDGTFTSVGSNGPNMHISGNIDRAETDLNRIQFGDFNGDGMTDVLLVKSYNNSVPAHVYLSKGDGTFDHKTTGPSTHVGESVDSARVDIPRLKIGDFNGDGLSDVYRVNGWGTEADANVYFSRGDGTFASTSDGPATFVNNSTDWAIVAVARVHIDDFDGDGTSDVHYAGGWGDGGDNHVYFSKSKKIVLEKIGKAGEGRITVSYALSTDETVHSDGGGDAHAARDPMELVKRVTVDDGAGGLSAKNYKYSGLKIDPDRRQMLGFASMTVTDEQTNIVTTTHYSQTFPRTGLVTGGSKNQGGRTISSVGYSYNGSGAACSQASAYAGVYITLPCKVTERTYDFDSGALLTTVTTTTTYDGYGSAAGAAYANATNIEVKTKDEVTGAIYTSTTVNVYAEDEPESWRLGRLTRSTVTKVAPGNPNSTRTSAFNYDDAGMLIREIIEPDNVTDPNIRLTTHYKRGDFGNITQTTLCESSISPESCDESITGPGVRRTITSYESGPGYPAGLFATKVKNALDHEETRVYDARFGLVKSVTGPNGLTTTSHYDNFGRKVFEERADGTQTSISYTYCAPDCPTVGNVVAKSKVTTASTGTAPSTVYADAFGREIRRSSPGFDSPLVSNDELVYVDTEYDSRGRIKRVSEPYFLGDPDPIQWTEYTYDDIDRVTVLNQPHTAVNVLTDYNGLSTAVTDVMGREKIEVKNAIGQTISVIEASNSGSPVITEYRYDAAGNLKETQIAGHAESLVAIEYDARGRKSDLHDPDMGHWQYVYNSFGELVDQIDALNQTTRMEYNKLGQMTKRTDRFGSSSERVSEWTFGASQTMHNVGKPVSVTVTDPNPDANSSTTDPDSDSSRQFLYDNLGRLTQTTDVIAGATFVTKQSYDNAGRPKTITYPQIGTQAGYKVTKIYKDNGYLQKVQATDGSQVFWEGGEVNARGQTVTDTLGNGMSTTRVYDAATGWLDALETLDTQSSAVQHVGYAYLDNGTLDSRTDQRQSLTETFGYDHLNRLTSSQVTGGNAKIYTYNILGNMISKAEVDYTYGTCGAGPHAVCQTDDGANVKTYDYNANGSVELSAGRTVHYTGFNKPMRFTEGGTIVSFAYGADLNRIFQEVDSTTDSFTYYVGLGGSGGALFERESKGGQEEYRHYIYAGGASPIAMHVVTDSGTTTTTSNKYFHHDHLGSVEAISDDSGLAANVVHMSYDAWGLRRNPDWSDTPVNLPYVDGARGFTGHEDLPEVSLIHMNGRVYDPKLGRFQSADPYMQPQEFSQGMNRYGYVLNNPLTLTDPTGYRSDLERFWKRLWKNEIKPFLNRLTRHCSSCGVGVGYGTNNGFHVYGGGQPSPYGNTPRADGSIPWQKIGSAAEEVVIIQNPNPIKAGQNSEEMSKDGEGNSKNGGYTITFQVTVEHKESSQTTTTIVATADEAGQKPFLQNLREGGTGWFSDLFRVRYHYRALNGDFGESEKLYAQTADTIITNLAAMYYNNENIEINGQTINFRQAVNHAVVESILNNKTYFAGRMLTQGATAGLLTRYSGGGMTAVVGFGGSFTAISGYGRILNLYDQGVRDSVQLMSSAITGL